MIRPPTFSIILYAFHLVIAKKYKQDIWSSVSFELKYFVYILIFLTEPSAVKSGERIKTGRQRPLQQLPKERQDQCVPHIPSPAVL